MRYADGRRDTGRDRIKPVDGGKNAVVIYIYDSWGKPLFKPLYGAI